MAVSGEAADKVPDAGPAASLRQKPLCYVLDNEAPLRRIISFSAAARNFRCVECTSIENLISRIFLESPDLIFIDIEFADADAVEIIRHLEQARYFGQVHLMSRRAPSLIETLEKIGVRRGLNMGHSLSKPFRRATVEAIFDEAITGTPLSKIGAQAPSLAPAAPTRGNVLREALDAGKVEVVFQPRFDFEIGRPYGAEAYARHAVSSECLLSRDGSTAHPDDVDRLTEFMLVSAMKAWRRFARPSFNPVIALRVPLSSLARLRIGEIMRRERPRSSEWPGLVMELTETEIATEPAKVHEIAAQMKIYGLIVSIGDFGTGHSALGMLEIGVSGGDKHQHCLCRELLRLRVQNQNLQFDYFSRAEYRRSIRRGGDRIGSRSGNPPETRMRRGTGRCAFPAASRRGIRALHCAG